MASTGRWPTATVGDSKNARNATATRHKTPPAGIRAGETLTDAVTLRTWPTPNVPNGGHGKDRGDNRARLEDEVHAPNVGAAEASLGAATPQTRLWPTPNVPNVGRTMTAEDVANKGSTAKGKRQVGMENAVKFWSTPAGIGGNDGHSSELGQAAKAGIPGKARVYQTPRATDGEKGGPNQSVHGKPSLSAQAVWMTPKTEYSRRSPEAHAAAKAKHRQKYEAGHYAKGCGPPTMDDLQTQVGGQLNPDWVEWLMGFPVGWTACDASATPSSRSARKKRGVS